MPSSCLFASSRVDVPRDTIRHERLLKPLSVRFDNNQLYLDRYWHAAYFAAVEELRGVAANGRLRAAFTAEAATYEGVEVFLPPPRLCTDNAAMIAVAGTHALLRGERAGPELSADPAWRL